MKNTDRLKASFSEKQDPIRVTSLQLAQQHESCYVKLTEHLQRVNPNVELLSTTQQSIIARAREPTGFNPIENKAVSTAPDSTQLNSTQLAEGQSGNDDGS
jgi:hypothetical protein